MKDVTSKYYDMLNSFRADNSVKVREIQEDDIAFGESYYDIEKRLIKNNDKRLMKDIELLEELEFDLRHERVKIIQIEGDE